LTKAGGLTSSPPLKGRDFRYRGATFRPGIQDRQRQNSTDKRTTTRSVSAARAEGSRKGAGGENRHVAERANRTTCILDAVSVGKDHSFYLLGLPTQCKTIDGKDRAFQAYRSFGLRHQIPTQDIRCSRIGVAGGARSASLRQDGLSVASDGEADHLHILVEYPPKRRSYRFRCWSTPSRARQSSRMLRRNRPDIASRYRDGVLWSPAYFAASAGGWRSSSSMSREQRQRAPSSP
jgi:putative transposase